MNPAQGRHFAPPDARCHPVLQLTTLPAGEVAASDGGQVKAAIAAMGGLAFGFAFMVGVFAERRMHQASLSHILGESPETLTQICEL